MSLIWIFIAFYTLLLRILSISVSRWLCMELRIYVNFSAVVALSNILIFSQMYLSKIDIVKNKKTLFVQMSTAKSDVSNFIPIKINSDNEKHNCQYSFSLKWWANVGVYTYPIFYQLILRIILYNLGKIFFRLRFRPISVFISVKSNSFHSRKCEPFHIQHNIRKEESCLAEKKKHLTDDLGRRLKYKS